MRPNASPPAIRCAVEHQSEYLDTQPQSAKALNRSSEGCPADREDRQSKPSRSTEGSCVWRLGTSGKKRNAKYRDEHESCDEYVAQLRGGRADPVKRKL